MEQRDIQSVAVGGGNRIPMLARLNYVHQNPVKHGIGAAGQSVSVVFGGLV